MSVFVTADNTHVLFFPFVTELKAVLQCDHTAADKVFKYLMPGDGTVQSG
jgi:hypothetical protein